MCPCACACVCVRATVYLVCVRAHMRVLRVHPRCACATIAAIACVRYPCGVTARQSTGSATTAGDDKVAAPHRKAASRPRRAHLAARLPCSAAAVGVQPAIKAMGSVQAGALVVRAALVRVSGFGAVHFRRPFNAERTFASCATMRVLKRVKPWPP
jgi:hypothetical protein